MGKIAIFVDHPRCSIDGVNSVIDILDQHYRIKIFTKHELPDGWFDDVDMVVVPGGIGDADTFHRLMRWHIPTIRDFVMNRGGRYLGICMGAYWAGKHYLNLLDHRDCVQYLARPNSETRRPHAKDLEVTWKGRPEKMFWYDGCSIVGSGPLDVVSTYSNGDAMAGFQGRVGLIGSHPEAQKYWYSQYTWMDRVYDEERASHNHRLLLEFTHELMSR